tara:strand:+ start:177 stop:596 length:420 start_codon:yes stop_codon:yes gene_type:complete
MDRLNQLKSVQNEGAKLFERKNKDYGDAFANYGPIGVIVRMGDKINRLSSVTNNGINLVKTESIRDTLIDLHNYAAMAIMLMDEDKKDISQNSLPRNDSYGHELSLQDNSDLPYSARWPSCSSPKNVSLYFDLPSNQSN